MSVIERTDDQAWLAWRAAGITATDIANAYTGSYGGAYAAVALKLGLIEPEPYTDVMARGHRWEERIADLVHVATGLYVHGEQALCQNADHPHHRATVDGFLSPLAEATPDDLTALLEVKTNGLNVRPSWERWKVQTLWQMHCTGIDRAVIVRAVIDDSTDDMVSMELQRIERDDFLIGVLVDLAESLWGHLQAGTLPDPDSATALDTVKALTAVADPTAPAVDLSDIDDTVQRYHELNDAMNAAKVERDTLGALIRSRMGGATKAVTSSGLTVTYGASRSERTPEGVADFLARFPHLAKPAEIDTKRAEAEQASELKAIPRAATGARSLTVKEPK